MLDDAIEYLKTLQLQLQVKKVRLVIIYSLGVGIKYELDVMMNVMNYYDADNVNGKRNLYANESSYEYEYEYECTTFNRFYATTSTVSYSTTNER